MLVVLSLNAMFFYVEMYIADMCVVYCGERLFQAALMSSPVASTSTLQSLPSYSNSSVSRLRSLYSDVSRQKQSNPSTFTAQVQWWHDTLEALVERGMQQEGKATDTLVLHANSALVERLRYDGVGKPLGLGAVVVSTLKLHTWHSLTYHFTSKGGTRIQQESDTHR